LRQQKRAVRPQQDGDRDIDGRRTAHFADFFATWRPDQSRANW
jgi:hypothetical protein